MLKPKAVSLYAALAVASQLTPLTGLAQSLPALYADGSQTSVSGLSSGGFMAGQYAVAFSANVVGVGIVAAGPFGCTSANFASSWLVPDSIQKCMTGTPDGHLSWITATTLARSKSIDPVQNIAHQKVYIFTGTKDERVKSSSVKAARDFYVEAKVPKKNLKYVSTMPANHAFIFPDGAKHDCGTFGTPFIVHCPVAGRGEYDQPKEILQLMYGQLAAPAETLSSQAQEFAQAEFIPSPGLSDYFVWNPSFAASGYVYIPQACSGDGSRACKVHVVFHGCSQSVEAVGDAIVGSKAYDRWADTNGIIVLYPQLKRDSYSNRQGCWDWFGYSSSYYLTQLGPQLAAVHAMVKRLTGKGATAAQ